MGSHRTERTPRSELDYFEFHSSRVLRRLVIMSQLLLLLALVCSLSMIRETLALSMASTT